MLANPHPSFVGAALLCGLLATASGSAQSLAIANKCAFYELSGLAALALGGAFAGGVRPQRFDAAGWTGSTARAAFCQGSFRATGKDDSYGLAVDAAAGAARAVLTRRSDTGDLGRFRRERGDRSCWSNDLSGMRFCAQ